MTYVPLGEAEQRLNFRIDSLVRSGLARKMNDGTQLISLKELAEAGAKVERAESGKTARVSRFMNGSMLGRRSESAISYQTASQQNRFPKTNSLFR